MPPKSLLHPRYWLTWVAMGMAWLIARLPLPALWWLGRRLGRLLYRLAHRRRDFAERNIALCFPHLNAREQTQLVEAHFMQLGMSLLEMIAVWFGRSQDFTQRLKLTGIEHLQQAQAEQRGLIICVFHTVHMEAMGLLLGSVAPVHPVYRPDDNPVIEWLMARHRSRHTAGAISNRKIKDILATLKQGKIVWLAPDQRNRGDGIVVPFFGHDTLTHPSIVRIARLTNAQLVPVFCRLTPEGVFELDILPVQTTFPSDNDAQDLTHLMQLLEADIAKAPAQYLWVHNRFNLP